MTRRRAYFLFLLLVRATVTSAESYSTAPLVDLNDVTKAPTTYLGAPIWVSGQVRQRLGEHIIILEQIRGQARSENPTILILVGDAGSIPDGSQLRIAGRVYLFSAREAEEVTGLRLGAGADSLMRHEPPVMVAERVMGGATKRG